jgi:hypothetical protein
MAIPTYFAPLVVAEAPQPSKTKMETETEIETICHGSPKLKTEEFKPMHQEPPKSPALTHAKKIKTADKQPFLHTKRTRIPLAGTHHPLMMHESLPKSTPINEPYISSKIAYWSHHQELSQELKLDDNNLFTYEAYNQLLWNAPAFEVRVSPIPWQTGKLLVPSPSNKECHKELLCYIWQTIAGPIHYYLNSPCIASVLVSPVG